ncbi:MAG: TonB-dependent receptor, partial [Alphaproteobacteria bacterium]|nr:TonB-dependent receptor [Alphaproteobacteria bacterium]
MKQEFGWIASAAVWLSAPCLAVAQEDDESLVASPVIVTTPGPARTADELIGNASALEREEIVETLAGSLGDTLDGEPGVSSTFFGQGASRPVLRGLGAERVQVLTNGIGVIDASAASPDHQVAADGIDAEKIEILRGPAALAYGGQAIGGVVNVIDGLIVETRPEEAATGEVFAAYNDVNEGTEAAGRARFSAGDLVFTLSGSIRDFGDYDIPGFAESAGLRALEDAEHGDEEGHGEEDGHDEDHDEDHGHDEHGEDEEHDHGHDEEETRGMLENSFVETATLAGGLSWVGERASFGVAVRRQDAEYGLPGHSHGHGGHGHGEDGHGEEAHDEDGHGEEGHGEEEHEDEEHGHEGHGEHGEENAFIDLEQTRVDLRGRIHVHNGFLEDIVATASFADYEHTEFEAAGEPGTVYESDGVEARLEFGHAIGELKGAFGLQYLDKELNAFGEEAFITPTATESLGLFLYETREWQSGFGIEGGLRAESVELDNSMHGSADFDLFSASGGVHRHFDGGVFVGAQLAYTERAPNESELFANGPHLATSQFEVGDPGLDKESGLNLEATARLSGNAGRIGVNLFVTDFSDFIFLTPGTLIEEGVEVAEEDGLPVFLFAQQDADFVGGEIYGEADIEDGPLGADWAFDASLDLVEAELDGGGNVPLIPPLTVNAGASAEWGAWQVGAQLTHAGEQEDPGAGALPTDSYT